MLIKKHAHSSCLKRKLLLSKVTLPYRESNVLKDKMIAKKVKDSNPKNYRPISTTSCLARLNEKIIKNRLVGYPESNNILYKYQSGFRKFRQTRDNIYLLVQKALEAKNRGWKALVLLFDIMEAFDKVWHEGLLHKLIKIGTPIYIINWVKGFLEGRSFDVRVKDAYSDKKYIECGVPQGAVLSPILLSKSNKK